MGLPIGGLSLVAHLMILLARAISKIFQPTFHRLKGGFLRWGLKFSRNFCLFLFAKDTFLRKAFASAIIICVFFAILSFATFTFLALSFNETSNFVIVNDLVRAGVVAVDNANNSSVLAFNEVPFAKEIFQADLGVKENLELFPVSGDLELF